MILVTIRIAVAETGPDVPHIAVMAYSLAAKPTETFAMGRPAVDQYEVHVAPPRAKQ